MQSQVDELDVCSATAGFSGYGNQIKHMCERQGGMSRLRPHACMHVHMRQGASIVILMQS